VATLNFYQNGLGENLGDELCTSEPLMLPTGASAWWVNSATGTDAASPAGQNREKPLATLSQAVTNALAGDIIVLMDGHTETGYAATLLVSKAGLKIVGAGSDGGIPTVTLSFASTGSITLNAADCEIRNVKFTTRTGAGAGAKVTLTTQTACRGCYFECAANDTGPAVSLFTGADYCQVSGCTFLSTATSATAQPESAIKAAGAITGPWIYDCIVSDGTVGFSNPNSLDLSVAAMTRFKLERVSFLLGADGKLHASSTGYAVGCTTTGGGALRW
jgi:hypothetical protein